MRASFACLHQGLDVRPILSALEAQPELWDQITTRQKTPGYPHVDTRTIFLRWAAAQTVEAAFGELEAIDYPALLQFGPAISDIINSSMAIAGSWSLGRVILVSLKAGGKISAHVDEGAYADHYERFHAVVQADFGNRFMCGRAERHYEVAEMRAGELWWFNHKRTHWVENSSNRDRIHLIMDMVAPNYRMERAS